MLTCRLAELSDFPAAPPWAAIFMPCEVSNVTEWKEPETYSAITEPVTGRYRLWGTVRWSASGLEFTATENEASS